MRWLRRKGSTLSRPGLVLSCLPLLAALVSCHGGDDGRRKPVPPDTEAPQPQPDPPPNVLILLIDDIAPEAIGVYDEGPVSANTPNMDALAARGMLFHNAYTMPVCSPTRACLLTGRYSTRHGLGTFLDMWSDAWELPLWEVTLPEMLDTAPDRWNHSVTGKWHLTTGALTSTSHPRRSGFDWAAGSLGNPRSSVVPTVEERGYYYWEKVTNGALAFTEDYMTSDTAGDAIERMKVMESPWLLYVPFNAAHEPHHEPPPRLLAEPLGEDPTLVQMYAASIEALDTEIGRVLDHVPDDTVILLLADNGPQPWTSSEPTRPFKGTVYEGGIRVPMIAAGPGIPEGTTTDALTHVVDLFPTVMEIAGVQEVLDPVGEPVILDGVSLLPVLHDPEARVRDRIFTAYFPDNGPPPNDGVRVSLRDERYKVMWDTGVHFFDLDGVLYEEEDLLQGTLSTREQEAFDRLSAELLTLMPEVRFAWRDADPIFAALLDTDPGIQDCLADLAPGRTVEITADVVPNGVLTLNHLTPRALADDPVGECLRARVEDLVVPPTLTPSPLVHEIRSPR